MKLLSVRLAWCAAWLVAVASGGASHAEEAPAPDALALDEGDRFGYELRITTTQTIDLGSRQMDTNVVVQEAYQLEVRTVASSGEMTVGVKFKRSHGSAHIPGQMELEFDSGVERASLAGDPMKAMLMVLVDLEIDARLGADGSLLDLPGAEEALGAHFDVVVAKLPEAMREVMRAQLGEAITTGDLEDRLRMLLQPFSADDARRWPFDLRVPATGNNMEIRMVGEHARADGGAITHQGELVVTAGTATLTESALTGRTEVDPATGRVLQREITATCVLDIDAGGQTAKIDQKMVFAVEPLAAGGAVAPDPVRATVTAILALTNACALYAMDQGHPPSDLAELTKPQTSLGDSSYMKSIPSDGYGNAIVYRVEGGDFTLVSHGADGKPDTDDDITQDKIQAGEYRK